MKALKFWIGDDPELSVKVQEALFAAGYGWIGRLAHTIQADAAAYIRTEGHSMYCGPDKFYFDEAIGEEINIDWMRTKTETVTLFGKKYDERVLKERLADCPTIEE